MSHPVRAVRFCLLAASVSFGIAWASIALFLLRILPPAEPYSTVGGLIALGGHLAAFVAVVLASIYGLSTFIREPERCDWNDLSLIVGAIILCGLCVYHVVTRMSGP